MITAEEFLADMINYKNPSGSTKLAIVDGLFPNGTAKVLFDGEDAPSEKQYAYISTYSPKVGDRVMLYRIADSYVLIGKIIYGMPPSGKKIDDVSTSASASVIANKINEVISVLRSYGLIF